MPKSTKAINFRAIEPKERKLQEKTFFCKIKCYGFLKDFFNFLVAYHLKNAKINITFKFQGDGAHKTEITRKKNVFLLNQILRLFKRIFQFFSS